MKRLFFFAVLLGLSHSLLAEHQLNMRPRANLLSSYYDVYTDDQLISSVKREHLHLNKIYCVSDQRGEYARGVAKLFSLGTLVKSLRKIDLYNEFDKKMGSINGSFTTSEKGKFTFLNRKKKPLATAYIDKTGSSVTIVNSVNEFIPIALFRRSFIPEGDYFWEIKIFDEHALEPSMLYIFAAFVTDTCWPSEMKPEKIPSWESLELLEIIKEIAQDE